MAYLTRKSIRDDLIARVQALGIVASNKVFAGRSSMVPDTELPAIEVYVDASGGPNLVDASTRPNFDNQWTLQIIYMATALDDAALELEADKGDAIERGLLNDQVFIGLWSQIMQKNQQVTRGRTKGNRPGMAVALTLVVKYPVNDWS